VVEVILSGPNYVNTIMIDYKIHYIVLYFKIMIKIYLKILKCVLFVFFNFFVQLNLIFVCSLISFLLDCMRKLIQHKDHWCYICSYSF